MLPQVVAQPYRGDCAAGRVLDAVDDVRRRCPRVVSACRLILHAREPSGGVVLTLDDTPRRVLLRREVTGQVVGEPLAVAERMVDCFSDGVVFVDLSTVRNSTLIAANLARALQIRELAGRDVLTALFILHPPRDILARGYSVDFSSVAPYRSLDRHGGTTDTGAVSLATLYLSTRPFR